MVVTSALHAFPYSPKDVRPDEFVLLSKNREDCGLLEKQVQNVAKLLNVRPASDDELDQTFPGVEAGDRWRSIVELYWLRPLINPFNLHDVPGFNAKRYRPVQGFALLDSDDEMALFEHLIRTNGKLLLDVINNAERPSPS